MGKLRVVMDFLTPADQSVLREENVRVTVALKKSSLEFFSKKGERTSYLIAKNDLSGYRLVCFTISKERLKPAPSGSYKSL